MVFARNIFKQILAALLIVSFFYLDCHAVKRKKHKRIEQTKNEVVSKQQTQLLQISDALICGICRDENDLRESMKNVTTLNCHERHRFHLNCLKDWSRISKSCPYCANEIPNSKLEKDDFQLREEYLEKKRLRTKQLKERCESLTITVAALAAGALVAWGCQGDPIKCLVL